MTSRFYKAALNYRSSHRGGRGHTNPTKVLRLGVDFLDDLDSVLHSWRQQCNASPSSPRYENVKKLLDEIDEHLSQAINKK